MRYYICLTLHNMFRSNSTNYPPTALTAVSSYVTGIFLCTCFIVIIYHHTLGLPNTPCCLSHPSFSILLLTNHTASSCSAARGRSIKNKNSLLKCQYFIFALVQKKCTTALNRAVLCDISPAAVLFHCSNHRQAVTWQQSSMTKKIRPENMTCVSIC